jgi:regulatory protein
MTSDDTSEFLRHIMQYCASAERCTQDVTNKLVSWNVPEEKWEEILDTLRRENFLDDTRYATSYVSDKWKLDHWGKQKIKHGLLQKGFKEPGIEAALNAIEPKDYAAGLHLVLSKKRNELNIEDHVILAKKLLSFAKNKGFEDEEIWLWLNVNGIDLDN